MVVTSFAQKGWTQYGKRFVQTFLDKWPAKQKLVIYYEEMPEDAIKDDRIEWRPLFEVPGITTFLDRILASEPVYQGRVTQTVPDKDGKPVTQETYDYRYDAYRFCRKVFAIKDAAKQTKEKYLAWIDADVVTHSEVPEDLFAQLLPANKTIAYLGRDWAYTETGFLLFNTKDARLHKFMDDYIAMYATGAFRYLGEWHDCYVFDILRTIHQEHVPMEDLSHGTKHDHPFVNSKLGLYMDHLKGPQRKKQGRSAKAEGIHNEAHPYWGGISQKDHAA